MNFGGKKMSDAEELDRFKREISLVEYAESRDYTTDRSDASGHVRMEGGDDIIVVRRDAENMQWVYFTVSHDQEMNVGGTIIDFVQHLDGSSIGEVRKTLRRWIGEIGIGGGACDPQQLPLWPKKARGVPNGVLRSALFGVLRKGRRQTMERAEIAAVGGVNICYTGQQLDQVDLSVWESVLHIVRLQEISMGAVCRFTASVMLQLLGRTDTGGNRSLLNTVLMRLKATAIEIEQGQYSYAGSLIEDVYRDTDTHEYALILDPKLRTLFVADQYTFIDWDVRQSLRGQMAKWLHGYYSTHAVPFAIKIETLLRLSGCESRSPRSAKQVLFRALDELSAVGTDWPFMWAEQAGLIHVQRENGRKKTLKKAKAKK